MSFGPESYLGFTALVNHASSVSTSSPYFSDVNADGPPDLVAGGSVLFNRLDASGLPSFAPDSGGTPVPIGSGQVDPSVVPNLDSIARQIAEGAPLHDTVRRWVAPYPGTVSITGDVRLEPAPDAGDGVRVAIQHNGSELWSVTIPPGDAATYAPAEVDAIAVEHGDRLYFRLQPRAEGSGDVVSWDPQIAYTGVPAIDAGASERI